MKPRILLAALPLAALFAACDDPSGPGTPGESRVIISYTGDVAGTFAAQGEYVAGPTPNTQTFASAWRDPDGTVEVSAYLQRGGGRFDMAHITLPQAVVGMRDVELCPGEKSCTSVSLALDLGQANGAQAAQSCHLRTGTLRITAINDRYVSGRVLGSGYCLPRDGGEQVAFQISDAAFDVNFPRR